MGTVTLKLPVVAPSVTLPLCTVHERVLATTVQVTFSMPTTSVEPPNPGAWYVALYRQVAEQHRLTAAVNVAGPLPTFVMVQVQANSLPTTAVGMAVVWAT